MWWRKSATIGVIEVNIVATFSTSLVAIDLFNGEVASAFMDPPPDRLSVAREEVLHRLPCLLSSRRILFDGNRRHLGGHLPAYKKGPVWIRKATMRINAKTVVTLFTKRASGTHVGLWHLETCFQEPLLVQRVSLHPP